MEMSSRATAAYRLEPVLQEPCVITMLFLHFLIWSVSKIQRLLPGSYQYSSSDPTDKVPQAPVLEHRRIIETTSKNQDDEEELTKEDLKIVMRNVGLGGVDQEDSMAFSSIGNRCISSIFDDEEPSLQEVSQAFMVFDDDNDGYIDALDLQRVLCSLGVGEGVGMDECEQMIARYDMNKDGRIDMIEFTKVLEASIC